MDVKVEEIKSVVNELNRRLNKKLNVISYDNLKGESRIEILLQVLKEIDPTVSIDTQYCCDHSSSVLNSCFHINEPAPVSRRHDHKNCPQEQIKSVE